MQLQFEKQEIPCLHTLKREVQSQEQTQEIRVSDGMPDIGSVIGAWGQVILRSKEWQADAMNISGGTMVWVQYLPEEGGQPCCVESWLPFQMRWPLPQTQHDGTILAQCILRGVDARSTSARKMMLRSNVSVLAWAMENQEGEIFAPVDVPEDVELLKRTYPMELPVEAGEKAFSLEETLSLPPSAPRMEKPVYFSIQPEITEERMMGDKVVFRGNAVLHMLYSADDGGEYSWDFDLPFTQYSELDREYGDDAEVMLWPAVTALEVDREEERMNLKAGFVCQYRITHRPMIEVVEDAYSPRRSVTTVLQELELPGILERQDRIIHVQQNSPVDGMRLTDIQFLPQPVGQRSTGEEVTLEIPGQFQLLYYDIEGTPRSSISRWEDTVLLPAGEESRVEASVWPAGKTQGSLMSGSAQLSTDIIVMIETASAGGTPMVTGLELGELREQDSKRPSLIIRRPAGQTLWELAKDCGSTVSAIREANGLQTEPVDEILLLIPVI